MSQSLHDRVVAALGHQYELESELGRGGMSVVYRARDLRLDRPVAIKVLPPELAHDPAIRTRFTREAQTAAHLAHAHIVPIHDVGDRDGIAYFVMALVTGGNLGTLLAHEPRLPVDEVRRIFREVADALAYAHLRGVIHRDIKPDNILLDRETGRAMVTDFGIARAIEAGTRLTATGIAVGTPTYMSPEQALGEREIDGRSDIYSLGVVAYQMVTGRVPFAAGNSMALLMKHVSERPRPIAELRPDAPRGMVDSIDRSLMKAPEDRWPTAATLRDALASGETPGLWRAPRSETVRFVSSPPNGVRRPSPPRGSVPAARPASAPQSERGIVVEPEYFAALTPEQREDLRLWHGRGNLQDRVKTFRRYALSTLVMTAAGFAAVVFGVEEEIPPLVLGPLVPIYMSMKLWRRAVSLRLSGLKLRRVVFGLRSTWAFPAPPAPPKERHLEKLVSREVLDGAHGSAVRQAVEDRGAILAILAGLDKSDRALLPDLEPTVKGLVDRVAHLARMLHRLDGSIDPRLVGELDARIIQAERDAAFPEGERRIGLLRRQRTTLDEIMERRAVLARQLDNAALALANLRFDLIKVRSSGLQSALGDVSEATQEARALSREIGALLEASAEAKGL